MKTVVVRLRGTTRVQIQRISSTQDSPLEVRNELGSEALWHESLVRSSAHGAVALASSLGEEGVHSCAGIITITLA